MVLRMRHRLRTGAAILFALGAIAVPQAARAFGEADVRAMVGNRKTPDDYPGAGGVWMGRERAIEIDGVGNAVIVEHLVARVLDPAWGAAQFAPYTRTYWSRSATCLVETARVWRSREESTDFANSVSDAPFPGTEEIPAYAALRQKRIDFPSLQQGDVVEIRIRWIAPIPRYDVNVRWFEEIFGAPEPVVEQQLVLTVPHAAEVRVEQIGPQVRPRTRHRGGTADHIWLTGNLPAIDAQVIQSPWSRVPAPDDSVGAGTTRVLMTTFDSWESVSRYFGEQWETAWNARTPALDATIASLVSGRTSPEERARAIERHVREEIATIPVHLSIQDLRPLDAGVIAAAGAAPPRDKTCLLVSMLRGAGIPAVPVLVRTRGGPWLAEMPSVAQLDRFIVRAHLPGGRVLWLDAVGDGSPLPAGAGLVLPGLPAPGEVQEAGLLEFPGVGSGQSNSAP